MTGALVARWLICSICLAALGACAQRSQPLYLWDSFPKMQYAMLTDAGVPEGEQLATLRAQAEKARARGVALPPGFRAHLGVLELNAGDIDQARRLWEAEKVAFPESSPYMNQLLKHLDGMPGKAGAT